MSRTGWIWVIILLIVVVGGAWWIMQPTPATNVDVNTGTATGETANSTSTGSLSGDVTAGTSTGTVTGSSSVGTAKTVTVNYDGSKFTPASVTINKGDTVTFVAASGKSFWVAADEHPTHTEFDGTSRTTHCAAGYTGAKPFDECAKGTTYSFTFDKTGSFDYHDHTNASAAGTVVVQ